MTPASLVRHCFIPVTTWPSLLPFWTSVVWRWWGHEGSHTHWTIRSSRPAHSHASHERSTVGAHHHVKAHREEASRLQWPAREDHTRHRTTSGEVTGKPWATEWWKTRHTERIRHAKTTSETKAITHHVGREATPSHHWPAYHWHLRRPHHPPSSSPSLRFLVAFFFFLTFLFLLIFIVVKQHNILIISSFISTDSLCLFLLSLGLGRN
uniref:Uncharacterized protein n=1 Tax=Arundo donax TaxID=35708 RepID=A0A0A9EE71_ARUDO